MPEALDEGEIQDVLDAYEREGTYKGAAQKVGVDKNTVKKYVERRKEDGSSDDDAPAGSVLGLSGDDNSLVDLTDQELMEMDPAEFIRTFFEEFDDMGVRDSFVQMIANQARLRQQVPDEDQMSQRIQSHNSGIGNANDANAIAELYWAITERYLRARGLAAGGGMAGGGMGMMNGGGAGGDWVGAGQSQVSTQPNEQQNSSSENGGDWVTAGGPGVGSTQGRQTHGQQRQPRGQQPQPGGQPEMASMVQQMLQQQQMMMREMMENQQETEKDDLRGEIEDLKRQLADDGSDDRSMTDSLKEVMELREMLDSFDDSNDNDQMEEVVGVLQQQLSQVQQEIRNNDNGMDMGQVLAQADNSQFALLSALAQSGDVEASELMEMANKIGDVETNPEVAEKKYEKDIEKMRVDAEREKWDSILDGAEQLASSLGAALGGVDMVDDDDSTQEAEPEVTATAQPSGESDSGAELSPAEQMVKQATGEPADAEPADAEPADIEPEPADVTPDNTPTPDPQPAGEQEDAGDGELLGPEEPDAEPAPGDEPVVVMESDGGGAAETSPPEPDPEPAEPEPGETETDSDIVCPFCGRDDFETERAMWGHKGSCPEKEDES